ncbi:MULTISPECIES: YncE family protein [unclassified Leucobacter]|uniref:YncE family protein n=1 Tax=unclassified Leucobacter TaxID=2621730 RepID=UPI00301A35DF
MPKTHIRPARRSAALVTALAAVAASFTWAGAAPALATPDPGSQAGWQWTSTSTAAHAAPRGITVSPDGARLFVNYEAGNLLSVLNSDTMGVSAEAPIEGWGEPTITTPAIDGYRVLTAGTNNVYSLTPGIWSGIATHGPGIDAMTYSKHTTTVFSTDAGQLSERDPHSGELIRYAGLEDSPTAIAAHPGKLVVYTADENQQSITAIDLTQVDWNTAHGTEDASTVLALPGTTPSDLAISADGSTLYVLDYFAAIHAIDTATFTVKKSRNISGADFASASLSVNPVTGELVASDLNGNVFFIDPASLKVTRALPLEEGLWDTAISPDGTKVYVTNTFESSISVLEYVTPAPNPATDVQAIPGARQAAVTWTASTTGSATYTVSAVGSSDVLCTTTSTSCVIPNLPLGSVQFVVTTTTEAGSTPSQPSAPAIITAPEAPNSVPTPTGDATIGFAGAQPTTALFGQKVDVVATGFAPSSFVDVSLHSSPMLLGSGVVGNDGTATFQVTIPASGVEPGAHHLVATGFTAQGAPAAAVREITLAAPPGPKPPTPPTPTPGGGSKTPGGDALARTGAETEPPIWAAALLLTAGAAAVTAARLRRRTV